MEGAFDCGGTTPCGEDNDPQLPCTLTVQLFGYPAGNNLAAVTIAGQAPSGSGTVLTDSIPFAGSTSPNGSLLDTFKTYSFSVTQLTDAGLTAQPQQGYHLRVSVAVNGWPAKTHVVWLDCTPVDSGSNNGLTGGRGLLRPTGDRALAYDSAGWPDASSSADSARIAGDTPASGGLAFTGFDAVVALAAALALLLLGTGLVVVSRRAKRIGAEA